MMEKMTFAPAELFWNRLSRAITRTRTSEIPLLAGKNIVLGVTGGIAAFKSADLASRLVQAGADRQSVLVAVGGGRLTPDDVDAALRGPSFPYQIPALPAQGLALWRLDYPKDLEPKVLESRSRPLVGCGGTLDVLHELRPALETVGARQEELRVRELGDFVLFEVFQNALSFFGNLRAQLENSERQRIIIHAPSA